MKNMPAARLLTGFAALALAACQTADVAARDAGVTPEKSTDEAGLWMQSERAENEVKRAGILIHDPELNAYVKGVACRVAAEYCDEVRIYLLESTSFNAFMMPNGTMAVFSGLMLRAENEAQLATVLGHEVGHYEENHSLERHRTLKRTAAFMIAGDLATGGLGTLAGILSLQGYSREHEREADDIGFRRLTASGYDGREAAKIWSNLIAESQASDFKRKQRRVSRSSLLDSHPAPPQRVETLQAKATAHPAGGQTEQAAYRAHIAPFLDDWLEADLQARDWGMSLHLIGRLKQSGRDLGVLTFHEAEIYRQRRETGDEARALAAYEKSAAYPDAPARVWRALGEAYRKAGETDKARNAYQSYLSRAPDAPDRAIIERTLSRLPEAPS